MIVTVLAAVCISQNFAGFPLAMPQMMWPANFPQFTMPVPYFGFGPSLLPGQLQFPHNYAGRPLGDQGNGHQDTATHAEEMGSQVFLS